MVEISDGPSSSYQLHPSVGAANAPRILHGADSGSPHATNDNTSNHGRNAPASGGPTASTRSLREDAITFDALSIHEISDKPAPASPPPAPPPDTNVHGEASSPIDAAEKPNILIRFYRDCRAILFASWINTLLVFVPVGVAVQIAGVSPTIVFALNAVAIVPLAGLLSYATESVASEMGDTVGALMNVTFGNAVELIIL